MAALDSTPPRRLCSAERGSRPGEPYGGQPVEPDGLDQPPDLRLRPGQPERAALRPQALRQAGEVDDHRRVGEGELREIDDDVARGTQRSRDRPSPSPARRPVLIPRDDQDGQLFIETDDRGNLLHTR